MVIEEKRILQFVLRLFSIQLGKHLWTSPFSLRFLSLYSEGQRFNLYARRSLSLSNISLIEIWHIYPLAEFILFPCFINNALCYITTLMLIIKCSPMPCGLQRMVIDGITGNMEPRRYNFRCWNCKLWQESQQLCMDPDFAKSIRGVKCQ